MPKKKTSPKEAPKTYGSVTLPTVNVRPNNVRANPIADVAKRIKGYLPSWLNPKNLGVTDYSDKGDRHTAFAAAKRAGEKNFMWNGKRYNTKSDMSEERQMKVYGTTDKQRTKNPSTYRKNLGDLNTTEGYETSLSYIGKRALGRNKKADFSNEPNSPAAKEQDAFRLYLGLPQRANTFKPSKYKKDAFEINKYNELLPDLLPSDAFIKHYGRPLKRKQYAPYSLNEEDKKAKLEGRVHTGVMKPLGDFVMGRHTVKKGKDNRGEYLEYIDKFDFDTYKLSVKDEPLASLIGKYNNKYPKLVNYIASKLPDIEIPLGDMADKVNKPFSIYGRKYYKDYGDGTKRAMYYTDKELSEFNDFDTLALQRELANRGYKLPKSTKKDGTFDGVFGDETRNALEDYRKGRDGSKVATRTATNGRAKKTTRK